MNDKYLLEISAKLVKTGTLFAVIGSLLVISNQAIAVPVVTSQYGNKQNDTRSSVIQEECSYSDYEIWACEESFPNSLASAPLTKLINAPTLLKLVVLPNGDYNKDAASMMINNLSKIPEDILRKLLISGGKIKLINGKLTDEQEYAFLKGVTPRGWEGTGKTWDDLSGLGGYPNVVVRIGYSEKTEGTMNLELHETGHAVDCVFNNISKSDNFREIWRIEVDNLFTGTCVLDYVNKYPEEYFAESFSMYFYSIEGKGRLKELAPLTYELISQLASSS